MKSTGYIASTVVKQQATGMLFKYARPKYGIVRFLLLTVVMMAIVPPLFSQDTLDYKWDTSFVPTLSLSQSTYIFEWGPSHAVSHNPKKSDTLNYNTYNKLFDVQPDGKNYSDYYSLAASLWELGKADSAEKMLLKIVASTEPFYTESDYHSSDIPGDENGNSYGYGSYTTNYKNYASRYLTDIYLERENFTQALKYVEYADRKYTVSQGCGTGHNTYRNEIDGMYMLCYEGLEMYDSIINMFLPKYYLYGTGKCLINAIKKVYTPTDIAEYLQTAEHSITNVGDSVWSPPYSISAYGAEKEIKIPGMYIPVPVTTKLFNRDVKLQTPSIDDGQALTRELFVDDFKQTEFYKSLKDVE